MNVRRLARWFLFLIIGSTVFSCSYTMIAFNVREAQWHNELLQAQGSHKEIKEAFIVALWLNDPVAYEITEPSLWSVIDEWMASHQVAKCSVILGSSQLDAVGSDHLSFGCDGGGDVWADGLKVDTDALGRLRVIGWDELRHQHRSFESP